MTRVLPCRTLRGWKEEKNSISIRDVSTKIHCTTIRLYTTSPDMSTPRTTRILLASGGEVATRAPAKLTSRPNFNGSRNYFCFLLPSNFTNTNRGKAVRFDRTVWEYSLQLEKETYSILETRTLSL